MVENGVVVVLQVGFTLGVFSRTAPCIVLGQKRQPGDITGPIPMITRMAVLTEAE